MYPRYEQVLGAEQSRYDRPSLLEGNSSWQGFTFILHGTLDHLPERSLMAKSTACRLSA